MRHEGSSGGGGREGEPVGSAEEREFSEFVAASSERLVRIGTLLTGDPHLAEDLVQASLIKAYLNWSRIGEDPFRYVRRTMANQRIDWWRRRRRRIEVLTDSMSDTVCTEDAADRHATRDLIIQVLWTLSRRERSVVVLRFFEDMSEAQISDELGIAPGTVKSALSRAMAKLRVAPDLVVMRPATVPARLVDHVGGA